MDPARRAAAAMVAAARPLSVRAVAMALLVLGLAAAEFALCVMTLIDPVDARFLVYCGPADTADDDGDAAVDMRSQSGSLLLSAATQAVAATLALLVPTKRALTVAACVLGSHTCYHANVVIHRVVDCHGHVRGALALPYWLLRAVEGAALLSGFVIALFGEE